MKRNISFLIIVISFLSFQNSISQYIYKDAFPGLVNFSYPVEIQTPPDGTNRMFVVQQKGKIIVFNNNPAVSSTKIFLDITSKVSQQPVVGLFGLAFHPNYSVNRHFYLMYVRDSVGSPSGKWLKIMRYTAHPTNPDTALPSTEKFLLRFPLPGIYHNGGKIAFGPDGYLYISFGDGYTGGGVTAQDRTTLLGKLLRINVDSASGGRNYSIPPSNPYYQNINGYREEIFAYGFRNMWKFSIDYPTGWIFGGDVGEQLYEEVDFIESGKNYGWNKMEGFHCYPPASCDTTGRGFTRPIFEYDRPGIYAAVTGGYVYRGNLMPELFGKYIYGDYEIGKTWALTYDGINPVVNETLCDSNFLIISYGTDAQNEIYVSSYSQLNGQGRIYRLVNTDIAALNLKAIIQGFYNPQSGKLAIRDTVKVFVHSNNSPYSLIDSSKCIIDTSSFSGYSHFYNAPTGKYYFVIKHRNSLETWSRTGGDSLIESSSSSYDFTSAQTQAYGNNLVFYGGKYCIYSGDVDNNGVIDGIDFSIIDNDAGNFNSGYIPSDLDGDMIVDGSDASLSSNVSTSFITVIRP
ncbi:MAG: hypothetical protein HGGPFJEG_00289 [Ignavibacteria bacterium]|nr:hypothetical protein [Ignavibacteria bacterium]